MRIDSGAGRMTAHYDPHKYKVTLYVDSVTVRMRENPKNKTLTISTT
jgi:hypothetical protein